jgi:hypothetical protein
VIEKIINILHLPQKCLVNKKITKAFFKRNFELTKNERNLLDDFSIVVSIDWIASISPSNSNVPVFTSANSTFEELQVIALQTNSMNFERDKTRLFDFVQKFIPYHTLLVVYSDEVMSWNTCIKRINENDSTKRVTENIHSTEDIPIKNQTNHQKAFFSRLSFNKLDKTNLKTLYIGYIQQIVALNAAEVRGEFAPQPAERTKQDVVYLEQIAQLEKEIVTLTNLATRETQMNLRVDYNLKIQQKRKQIEEIKKLIST